MFWYFLTWDQYLFCSVFQRYSGTVDDLTLKNLKIPDSICNYLSILNRNRSFKKKALKRAKLWKNSENFSVLFAWIDVISITKIARLMLNFLNLKSKVSPLFSSGIQPQHTVHCLYFLSCFPHSMIPIKFVR